MVRLLDQVMVPRVPTRKERTEIERMDHRMAQPNQARVCAESTVYTVRVEPQGIELAARHGETVMAAAERLGWKWPTIGHGDDSSPVRLRLPSPDSWRRHRGQEGGHA